MNLYVEDSMDFTSTGFFESIGYFREKMDSVKTYHDFWIRRIRVR